jgi:hypothetical protein
MFDQESFHQIDKRVTGMAFDMGVTGVPKRWNGIMGNLE